jgi:hypothetical protein
LRARPRLSSLAWPRRDSGAADSYELVSNCYRNADVASACNVWKLIPVCCSTTVTSPVGKSRLTDASNPSPSSGVATESQRGGLYVPL